MSIFSSMMTSFCVLYDILVLNIPSTFECMIIIRPARKRQCFFVINKLNEDKSADNSCWESPKLILIIKADQK